MNALDAAAQAQELRDRAARQIRSNMLDEAQATLESLIRMAPQDVPACLELADLLYRRGHLRASSAPLLQVVGNLPRNVPLILHVIQHLIARGEIVAARRCLDFLAQAPHPPPQVLVSQAQLRFSLGEVRAALDLMERAIGAGADQPADHHMHAMLLQFNGDIDGACDVLEKCLERWPDFGDAIVTLVNLRKQKPDANRLRFIEDQARRLPAGTGDAQQMFNRAEFEYARFKVLDDLGQLDEAWPALMRCNALMHELNPYDAGSETRVVDALIDMPADVAAPRAGVQAPPFDGPVPIFIVGMPRSGTTLLDRMLSSHSKVRPAGELIEFWRQLHWVADERPERNDSLCRIIQRQASIDYREVGARYLEQTQWLADGHAYYIDKLPANIRMVAFIRRALPHAPILNMVRDPMDVCFSNFKALFGNGTSPYSYDLQALAHYFREHARLCAHWHRRAPGCMLDVPYASLVGDPAATITRVLEHCGLEIEDACVHPERNTAPVATPSNAQVRQPIHRRGLGQWQRYAEPLQSLREALADLL